MENEKLDYFIEHTNADLKDMKSDIRQILLTQEAFKRLLGLPDRVEKVEKRIDKSQWTRHGAAGVISAIIAALIAFFGKG